MIDQDSIAHLVNAQQYGFELANAVAAAQKRVLLETMVVNYDGEAEKILDASLRARKNGASVMLIYDRYSHLSSYMRDGLSRTRELQQELSRLADGGVVIKKVGRRELNPFAGRHHTKAAIVDDVVYAGGGINLTSGSFAESHDYMWRLDDAELADSLYEQLPGLSDQLSEDKVVYKSSDFEVIVDTGAKGESLIYNRTCELANEAERIYYVSKLMPDGTLLDILKDKDVGYWFNTPSTAGFFDKLAILIDSQNYKLNNQYNGESVLHAKFCVFVMPDGSKQAISGSHNFNSRGVDFGTKEIALHITNQDMCGQLIDFANQL